MPKLDDVRRKIPDGALITRQRRGLITLVGRGKTSHVMMACWRADSRGGTLAVCEAREWKGARVVALRQVVRECPGQIRVYAPTCRPEVSNLAATIAYRWCIGGHGYDYMGIARLALMHAPVLSWLVRYAPDPTKGVIASWDSSKFCSYAFVFWYQEALRRLYANIDPPPTTWQPIYELGARYTEPSDLVRNRGSFIPMFDGEALSL